MSSQPSTASGGGGAGHRPPDPPDEPRDSPDGAFPPTGRGLEQPAVFPSHSDSGGPHHPNVTPALTSSQFPAPVTTPSDAQGGHSERKDQANGGQNAEEGHQSGRTDGQPLRQVNYAVAVRNGGQLLPKTILPPPTTIVGQWKPRERHVLLDTLRKNWHESTASVDTDHQAQVRQVSLAPSEVRDDTALRPLTAPETEALLDYLNGALELPHAPNFLKATLPLIQRAMIEQFHESHLEVMLTANVSPSAKLRRNMTHNSLITQLYAANADTARGRQMIDRIMDDVKMLPFDGIHTLKFVFNSQRVAVMYTGLAFRLNGTCIELEDSGAGPTFSTYRPARLRRQYAVRVYGAEELGLVVLLTALGNLPGVQVVDAERPRFDSTDIVDNRFLLLRFHEERCPAALRGVMKIELNGHLVTLHHHVVHQRLPCRRCYAPFHTTGFCKTKPLHLERQQAQFKRTYTGPIPSYTVGTAIQYQHSDGDSLINFLDNLQDELAGSVAATMEGPANPVTAALIAYPTEATEPPVETTRPISPGTQSAGRAETDRATAPEPSADAAEFHLVTRRHQRRPKDADAGHTTNSPSQDQETTPTQLTDAGQTDESPRGGTVAQETATRPATVTQQTRTGGPPGSNRKRQPTVKATPPAFAKFKRERARGRFDVLADADGAESDMDSADENDEAPYAYSAATPPARASVTAHATAHSDTEEGVTSAERRKQNTGGPEPVRVPGSDTTRPHSLPARPLLAEQGKYFQGDADTEMLSDTASDISGYVGSSAPSYTQSPAPTPGSGFPFSLDSDLVADTSMRELDTPEAQPGPNEVEGSSQAQPVAEPEALPTPLNQDGFYIEKTTPAPGMPQQLPVFLLPFRGALTSVPANGQCAYAALYASTTSTVETKLKFTSDVVKGADIIKRSVYTLMMANLANDVDCQVVDPRKELQRLYPSQPPPTEVAVAPTALHPHYAQERVRTVNTHIPSAFWAGTEVLRAMSQYLREPLFVLDVDSHNDAHVQRYFYKDYTLSNGDTHETGCGGAMDDTIAKIMLAQYARLHVLPIFLVLKRHEGHFYGVHHGDISPKWQAEGDLEFARVNCATHPWYSEVITHIEYSSGRLGQTELMLDDAATNTIIIGALERRDRLDVIHDRLRLPRLDSAHYDIAILEDGLSVEANRLQRRAGATVAPARQASSIRGLTSDDRTEVRTPISSQEQPREI